MAPKALKRQVASTAASGKRGRNEFTSRCAEVVSVLRSAETGLPVHVVSMIVSSAEPALRDFKEDRGEHQEVAINWLSSALDAASAKLTEKIDKARAGLSMSETELAGHESAVKDAEDALEKLSTALADATAARAEAEEASFASQQALTDAQNAQLDGDSEVQALTEQKQKLEAMTAGAYAELKGQVGTKKAIDSFVKALKAVKADPAMLTALPGSLAKAAAERSEFDQMVLVEVDDFLAGSIAALTKQIDEGAAGVAERASAVTAASSIAESAKQQLDAAEAAASESKGAVKEADRVLKEAKKARKDFMPLLESAKAEANMTVEALRIFNEGPLASFQYLRDQTAPVPEAPHVSPEAASASPAGKTHEGKAAVAATASNSPLAAASAEVASGPPTAAAEALLDSPAGAVAVASDNLEFSVAAA